MEETRACAFSSQKAPVDEPDFQLSCAGCRLSGADAAQGLLTEVFAVQLNLLLEGYDTAQCLEPPRRTRQLLLPAHKATCSERGCAQALDIRTQAPPGSRGR